MKSLLQSAGLDTPGAPRPLEGRAALVTGSTSGIGMAIAESLAAQGAMVVINGLGDEGLIEQRCRHLGAMHNVSVRYDDADISKPEAVVAMIERSIRVFGQLDILVNNAGIQYISPIETMPVRKWDDIIAINLSAIFHATRAVLPDMRKRGWGRIVNVASAHGLVASPFKSAYVAAKHGAIGFTKATALEAAEAGITCNAVCTGYVWTPLVEQQIAGQAEARGISKDDVVRTVFLAEQPSRRFVTVEEVAGTVTFLCSPRAASITGAAITIDGGWTAH